MADNSTPCPECGRNVWYPTEQSGTDGNCPWCKAGLQFPSRFGGYSSRRLPVGRLIGVLGIGALVLIAFLAKEHETQDSVWETRGVAAAVLAMAIASLVFWSKELRIKLRTFINSTKPGDPPPEQVMLPSSLKTLHFFLIGVVGASFLTIGISLFLMGHPWWGVFWFCGLGEVAMWPLAMASSALIAFLAVSTMPSATATGAHALDGVKARSTGRKAKLWCALGGLGMLFVMGLFPPWSRQDGTTVYSPIFSRPPYQEWVPRDSSKWAPNQYVRPEDPGYWDVHGVSQIDLIRLLVQAFVVVCGVAGAIVVVGLRENG